MNFNNNDSFFYKIRIIQDKYNLQPIHVLQNNIPDKLELKYEVKNQINIFWILKLREEAGHKLNLTNFNSSLL